MTTYLVAVTSVHDAAAACDYLESRADADDVVVPVAVPGPGLDWRDAEDATNVLRARLAGLEVSGVNPGADRRDAGTPVDRVVDVATEALVVEIVVPAGILRPPPPETDGDREVEWVQSLVSAAGRPVVILPDPGVE